MDTVIKNFTPSDIITYPFPHLDIKNALPEKLINQLLNELPSKIYLKDYFDQLGDDSESAVDFSVAKLKSLGFNLQVLEEFIDVHSSATFKNEILNMFNDYLLQNFPLLRKDLLSAVEAQLFINPFKTKVSSIGTSKSTFIRGPHLDDAIDISVFLFYLKHKEDNIRGGSLDLYKYKSRFKGFRRDIWWDEREINLNHVQKVKSVPFENNRFILLLDGINSIHGVTPIQSDSDCFRLRISGGISTPSEYRHYEYTDSLTNIEKTMDKIGIYRQKITRKLRRYNKFK
tara:strand:- start:830 stop:1687 length:858 start_codon:yes stop_codon:yes gene_type:complete